MNVTSRIFTIVAVALGFATCHAQAVNLLSTPIQTRSSTEFNASFAEENLFNGAISVVDIGTTNNVGSDYAGAGLGPHTVYMELAGSELTDGFVYAQRLGGNPALDKVIQAEFWFENASALPLADNSGFTPPARAPDEIIAINNLTPQFLQQYNFSGSYDAQYAFVRLTGNSANPGGAEFRFTNTNATADAIPEPATASLAMLGIAGLITRRRRIA